MHVFALKKNNQAQILEYSQYLNIVIHVGGEGWAGWVQISIEPQLNVPLVTIGT